MARPVQIEKEQKKTKARLTGSRRSGEGERATWGNQKVGPKLHARTGIMEE